HGHGMILHMDGSRLSNAAAHLDSTLAAITSEVGVDVLSLGGTKNGLLGAEAVIALNPAAVPGLDYLRKTNMQLGSKMRFVSAQLIALYEADLWRRSAGHANAMAARLRQGLEAATAAGGETSGQLALPYATESNVVFAKLSQAAKDRARAHFHFYDWPGDPELVRLMCSFDTTADDVDALVAAIRG
ncbi:MAG: threonine aldolase, partial [Actinobacteria bacterium]|nr:threonine aldolase [Actinomycetota bacterium]